MTTDSPVDKITWAAKITSPSSASGGAVGSPVALVQPPYNSAALSITSVVIGA